jgi:hypothetical protein
MAMSDPPADTSPGRTVALAGAPPVPAPPSWPWRRAALFLAGAAQLITISALVGADPLAVTWWSLLLAIAPAPVAAVAAFAPAPVNRLAAVAGVLVLSPVSRAGSCIPGFFRPGACGAGRRYRQALV